MEQNFISRIVSPLLNRYNRRTDPYTQPLQVQENLMMQQYQGYEVDGKLLQYVSYENNEFNLYCTTPELSIVINKGAELFANGRWIVKDYKTNEPIENHELVKLLEKPNSFQSRNEFLSELYVNRCLYGNNFTYLNYANVVAPQLPKRMVNLNPYLVALKRTGRTYKTTSIEEVIEKYLLLNRVNRDINKPDDAFSPNEILHIKMPNPDDSLLGMAPLAPLHMCIANIRAGRGYINVDYTKKGAHGFLTPESKDVSGMVPMTPQDRQDLEHQYSNQYSDRDENVPIMITNKPTKFVQVSSSIKDHMIHEDNDLNFKRIIDGFGLNLALFSNLKQSTFSNQRNGEIQAYQNGIIPFAESLSYLLTDQLGLIENFGVYVELNYDHVSALQEDEKVKAETNRITVESIAKLVDLGYTREEASKILGFDLNPK